MHIPNFQQTPQGRAFLWFSTMDRSRMRPGRQAKALQKKPRYCGVTGAYKPTVRTCAWVRRSDPTVVLHADAVMIVEGHVMACAVALRGLFASLLGVLPGVEMNIQVVMLFRVTAALAVRRSRLSHWSFLSHAGLSSSMRFGHPRQQGLSPYNQALSLSGRICACAA